MACGGGASAPQPQPVALHLEAPGFGVPGTFLEVNIGTTMNLQALPIAADSTLVGAPALATWQSDDTNVATVTNKGAFRSNCVGVATITAMATVGGRTISGSIPIGVGSTGGKCVLP